MFPFKMWGWVLSMIGFKKKFKPICSNRNIQEEDEDTINYFIRSVLGVLSILIFLKFFIMGSINANDPKECRVNKISEVIVTLPYAIGCNLFKNRFDIKLN